MAEWRFWLLGRFMAHQGDRPLELPGGLPRILLKVLLTTGAAREVDLARWLVPQFPARRGRERVRDAAALLDAALRRQSAAARVEAAPGGYRLVLPADTWTDLEAFRAWCRAGQQAEDRGDSAGALAAYQEAEALYLGEVLQEEAAGEWLAPLRRQMHGEYAQVLRAMSRCWGALGNEGYAAGFQAKARALEPGA